MEELIKELGLHYECAPKNHGKDFIVIKCSCEFEPHGRATETWELLWTLELPQIPWHVKLITGWKKGKTNLPMRFSGRTLDSVIKKAITFAKESKWKR
jgi:hypothetical protein